MCSVKAPKIQQPDDKDPIVIRNRYLDGVGPAARAQRVGRNSLRIERGSPVTPGPPAAVLPPRPGQPGYMPIASGGGGSRAGGGFTGSGVRGGGGTSRSVDLQIGRMNAY